MAKEERIQNPAFGNIMTIVSINVAVIATIRQKEPAFTSIWMIKSLNNQQLITWLKQIREVETGTRPRSGTCIPRIIYFGGNGIASQPAATGTGVVGRRRIDRQITKRKSN